MLLSWVTNKMRSQFKRLTLYFVMSCMFFSAVGASVQQSQDKHLMLSQKQLEDYEAEGILVIRNFFSPDELQQVAQCADRLQKEAETLSLQQSGKVMHKGTQFVIDRNHDQIQIHRIVWAGAAEPQLLRLARQPKLLKPVAQILGSDQADQLINQLHYKIPKDGVKFAWHQDVKNRRTFDPLWEDLNHHGSFVQTIIAVDQMTADNGTIFYVPYSHKRGDLFLETITDDAELTRVAELDKAVPLLLNPGDIIFMHPYLVHGSEANESTSMRRIFINGFSYPGANKQPYPGEGSAERIVLN